MKNAALLMLLVLGVSALPGHADDAALRPPQIVPEDGAVTPSTGQYLYDPSGNVTAIGASSYVYDPMGRVVTAAVDRFGNVQSQTYTYDAYGNRTSDGVTSYAASASTNRLTTQGAQYDAAGNLTQWQPPYSTTPRVYSYDALNTVMLEKVAVTGGNEYVAHIYNVDDERYWSFRGGASGVGVSRFTLRDQEGRVLREFSEPTADDWSVRDYVYRDGQLLASHDTRTGDAHHYSLDHLGTPRVVTNQDAEKVGEHTYFPFGAEYTDGSPTDGRLHFTGHEQRDGDLLGENRGELDYMHARYYSPTGGRFTAVDPAAESASPFQPQSWNRYAYAVNGPMNFVDPDGRQSQNVLRDMRTILITYRLIKTAMRESSRLKIPTVAGGAIKNMTRNGVKGWDYVSFGLGDAMDNRDVITFTGQYHGFGMSLTLDFDSMDRSSLSLLGLIFQKTFIGDEPDKISLGFGKMIGAELDIPIQPLALELVESLSQDEMSLLIDTLESNPELKKGLNLINGVLFYVH